MQPRPTHSAITTFITTLLPPKPNDVQLLYHVPQHPRYAPDTARIDQIVLSVAPTPGVYDFIGYGPPKDPAPAQHGEMAPRLPRTLCFLHRPFTLDRRRVRRGTLVLASHTSFDENLTVGWNAALAAQLGMDLQTSDCVQGYKGDPERKIGIVGRTAMTMGAVDKILREQFGPFESRLVGSEEERIDVVAIMNAFNPGEVDRVLDIAKQRGWIASAEQGGGRHVLYLTGQPRESGMAVAKEYGVQVVCVGHRAAEEWGIRYMSRRLRENFPGVDVKEIYEEEEPRTKDVRKEEASRG
ncbi:uncharacterized protein N0V89_002128 [Didymosphaeria variabile]|uniref:NGG1p interacting factor 3 n=1 Tax=Didymosphaeria variabile TaxID=1932322 RepID=A0A9W8XR37_9PLEO|nr:uncharacterized protein N0V89_002128 [Didymosphaeria variabile]KAJ4357552.1 hypothetical protein N0V89_002128 [Didymosphaeria variabile]